MSSIGLLTESSIGAQAAESSIKWSLEPLLHGHLPSEIFKTLVDFDFFKFVGCMMLVLALLYPLMHRILVKTSKRYAALEDPSKQIIVTHHALEAIVLCTNFPIFTYFFVGVFFRETNDLEEILSYFRGLMRCAIVLILVYAFELATRFQQPRPMIVFHHVLSIMDMLLICFFPTSIVFKSAIILVYNICFEAIIFVGFFLYRIIPERRIASDAMMAGIVIFGITRPLQVLMVGAAVFGSWGDDGEIFKWQAIFQFVVAMILTVLQIYTIKIQFGVWQRCVAKRKAIIDGEDKDINVARAQPITGIDDEGERDIESKGVMDKDESTHTRTTIASVGSTRSLMSAISEETDAASLEV